MYFEWPSPERLRAVILSRFGSRILAPHSPLDATPEQIYYNSEEHFHEMPYRLGDRLPRNWNMQSGWPNWGRPPLASGAALVLLAGPVSITALSVVETWRLRQKYPADFPFRDGPLPPRLSAVTHGSSHKLGATGGQLVGARR